MKQNSLVIMALLQGAKAVQVKNKETLEQGLIAEIDEDLALNQVQMQKPEDIQNVDLETESYVDLEQ